MYVLVGDIGKTIGIRLVETLRPDFTSGSDLRIVGESHYQIGEYNDLTEVYKEFIKNHGSCEPEKACFAVPGPVRNGTVHLTNQDELVFSERSAWRSLNSTSIRKELGISHVSLINDLEAVCLGIRYLDRDSDLHPLRKGDEGENREVQRDSPAFIAVLGCGTGLGEAFMIRGKYGTEVYPSEGSHANFAASNEKEFRLLQYLARKYADPELQEDTHVSVERVVSGRGIVDIYQFLRKIENQESDESKKIDRDIETLDSEIKTINKTVDPAAEITKAALNGDPLCKEVMSIFFKAYGSEAGNVALKFLPYNGVYAKLPPQMEVYLTGSIDRKALTLLDGGNFLLGFEHKGRLSPLLQEIPVYVILERQVGMIGAITYAAGL